jgi:glycosyltransferase involved in cell wall biosynthesis
VVVTDRPLHERLAAFVVDAVEALERTHLPGFRIPRVFAGHEVNPDVRADLAFTLGHLGRCGVHEIAGGPLDDALEIVLRDVDGRRTHTFFSYRIAETLTRRRHLLDRFDAATTEQLFLACDSTSYLPAMAEGRLPKNYAAVLLRCEVGRERLGLAADAAAVDDLTRRTIAMLDSNPGGYLDDSQSGIGRFDIYSGDIYLFTEPFAERLGGVWERGARAALDLVERVGATNGAAFPWGRSSGALAACLTIELGGLAASHDLGVDVDRWLARADHAFVSSIDHWFAPDGLITAHQHRSTFGYRGPFRRLQMTLDCLGKLADTAAVLREAGAERVVRPDRDLLFPPRDELVSFDAERRASVWTYRSRDLAFVVPIVGSTVSDYLPAPHNPGLFEVPVDADLPTAVPVAFRRGVRFTSGHLPASVDKSDGGLSLRYDGFPQSHQFEIGEATQVLSGTRVVSYRVEGRTLHADEELTFPPDGVPHALAVQVAEAKARPLRVSFRGEGTPAVIDVSGLKEYRSFWSELDRVHQLDLEPATDVHFGWSITPVLRVLTTGLTHHYHRAIYDPLVRIGAVVDRQVSTGRLLGDPSYLAAWDQFHLHWPEWFLGPDLARHEAAIEALRSSGLRIVWTQHNLVPHDKDPRQGPIYAAWAAAADGVVHHSEYGRQRVTERYEFAAGAVHRVIPHVHFGHLVGQEDGDRTGPIRLGIVGAPRAEKDVQSVLDAFARVERNDVELHVFSLSGREVVPDDPRVTAVGYAMVDRELYDERLRSLDALVLPFVADGDMITTGTVGDVVGAGLAALTTGWGYLAEALGDAAILYGDDLTAVIEGLDRPRLAAAAAAARALRPAYAAERIAGLHLELLETVGTARL